MHEFAGIVYGAAAAATANRLAKDALCFSKAGELLLHGPLLWDWRTPRAIHCFDVFSETPGSSSFHPYGLEVILNSEVMHLVSCLPPCSPPTTRCARAVIIHAHGMVCIWHFPFSMWTTSHCC